MKKQSKRDQQLKYKNHLSERLISVRMLKKNCVNLIGVPKQLANVQILVQKQFLGQYGKIKEIYVQPMQQENNLPLQRSIYSVYVNFNKTEYASKAIICLNGFQINKTKLKACYGITRYCLKFLKNQQCSVKDCAFLHQYANPCEYLDKRYYKKTQKIKSVNNKDVFQDLITSNFNFKKLFFIDQKQQKYNFFPGKIHMIRKFLKFLKKQQYAFFQSRNIQLDAFNSQQFNHLFWENFFVEYLEKRIQNYKNSSDFFLMQAQFINIYNLFDSLINVNVSYNSQSNEQQSLEIQDKYFQKQINQRQSLHKDNKGLVISFNKKFLENADKNQQEDVIGQRTKNINNYKNAKKLKKQIPNKKNNKLENQVYRF